MQGAGARLEICNYLVDYAFDLGGSKVSLNVYRENSHALRLYKSLGFKEQTEKSDDTNIFMLKT